MTVPARKYNLKSIPDGNVAVVFQDANDALMIDQLLGPLAAQLEKPLALRYCSSIKSFCSDQCFASSRDKSCLTHVKPRRAQTCVGSPKATVVMPEHATASKRAHAEFEQRPKDLEDESWVFNDILSPEFGFGGQFGEEDVINVQNLSDIFAPIHGLQEGDPGDATLESLLVGEKQLIAAKLHSPIQLPGSEDTFSAPSDSTRSESTVADSRKLIPIALQSLWNESADSTDIMSLGHLLTNDMAVTPLLSDPSHELWSASTVDVLDETFKPFDRGLAQLNAPPAQPKPKLGRKPPKGIVPAPHAPPGIRPTAPINKRQGANPSKMQNMKTMKMTSLLQQQAAPKPPASLKGKCVWKQLVTYC